ncbi:MAG: signal peptide peptidase SppA [Deltaproteobacteria bacterium]|nr:signal peptide peptidase SppA [Deltaproteobacteria bacterium]
MLFRFLRCLIVVAAFATFAGTALAQDEVQDKRPTDGVLLPTPSITETRDSTALAVNPSNLALLDSWSFTYIGSWLQEQEHLAGQGHGFFFGFPIGPLALGIGTEILTPSEAIRAWQDLDDRMRFSLGLAYHFHRAVSLGLAYRTFWFYNLGEIHTLDIGLTVHPINYLALSFVVSDANAPKVRYDTDEHAPRRFNVGLTVRPIGNDRLALGGELEYRYGDGYRRTDVRALLTGMIVDGLTIRGRFGAEGIRDDDFETGYFIDGMLAVDLPSFGVGLSMHGQVSPDNKRSYQGTTWSARFSGDEAPSITLPRPLRSTRAAQISIDKKLDGYGMTRLTALIERMERDDAVDMLVLRPGPGTMSLAQAQEVRRLIRRLQDSDRSVVCYLTEATGPVYLACAAADQTWINPAGGIRISGLSSRRLYFRDLFDKIGVNADIVRIGEYKSAPEMFTRTGPSEASILQMDRYFDTVYHHILTDLATDRNFGGVENVRSLVEQGPFVAREALTAGLVDKIVPMDTFVQDLESFVGRALYIDNEYGKNRVRHRRYLDAPAVAVVHIDGDLIDGESIEIPFFNIKMTGAKTITKILRKLGADRQIQAVVLRINSPGGSVLASDIIWREVMALRREKPVIASMGGVAASGAYYIASAANEIYSEATTMTGSIGIYYGKADLSGLLEKIGVDVVTFKRGAHADAESWARPYTAGERKRLMTQIQHYYDQFRDRVVEGRGRGFTREIVDKFGQGRIWSGADARYHMLVDAIGGYSDALNRARTLGRVPADIRVFQYPGPKKNLLWRIVSSIRSMVSEPSPWEHILAASGMKRVLRSVIPFAAADAGAPQARLPFAVVDEP